MKRTIRLHPQSFGRKMSEVLHKTLEMEVRGVSLGKAGYCVCVLQVRPGDSGGKIQESLNQSETESGTSEEEDIWEDKNDEVFFATSAKKM